ncbi:MAG: malto-oligosyltrehalose synthase [Aphanothece sp. CMT-3BRIN-NPC111]|jgi:(1->4)-alpha-D-glucan 1-alpha-D-glucosylmutase|nr:malto-oligosyltrehalose synthase [Aphanothece sp. CMT-3BRIN-NPC111]
MRIPTATYRIQFNSDFGFDAAKKIVDYISELGISDLYASPIFKARAGSTHGYDIVDPNQLNPELGTTESFEALIGELQQRDMGWLQDIVPNHMAYDSQNQMLMDVLENGPDSDYLDFFDIEWNHYYEQLRGRVLTPMLGDFYGNCLENGEIKLEYDQTGLSVNYYSLRLPVRIESYGKFLNNNLGKLARSLRRNNPDFVKMLGILYIIKNIPAESKGHERYEQASFVKGLLWELYNDNPKVKEFIDSNIEEFNGEPGNPESFNLLESLLAEQFYSLSFWKVGAEELNYRRFFTVNELISVKIEELKVFNKTNTLLFQLVESGNITGLRIDHIDGLYDPTNYLERLRQKAGDVYITVEKILELEEEMPDYWKIQGTSGYNFMNYVNGLFCCKKNEQKIDNIYRRFTGLEKTYEQVVSDCKRLIIDRNLAGDIDNLAHLIKQIANKTRKGNDFTLYGIRKAIAEFLALFPIYRTYINNDGQRKTDSQYIESVLKKAKEKTPQLFNELNFIEKLLLLEFEENILIADKDQWLHLVMRMQQYTGPLMAKGVEDTTFYVYNRMMSLNEVGGHPGYFGMKVADFHKFNETQSKQWPDKMNATSTHDTKRGEDVRARLNVISEIPEEWEKQVKAWSKINNSKKKRLPDFIIPDENDEYLFYQNLLGAFPFDESEEADFTKRVKEFIIKAIREAKVHTAWLRPDTTYEEGCMAFVEEVLNTSDDNEFLKEFRPFQKKIAEYGIYNSLSQTLLKVVSPGVPDFYQGTELWDLSLVDPDNRRPVDFDLRTSLLKEIKDKAQTDILGLMAELLATKEDARIKMFLTAKLLEARKQHLEVFQEGDYLPLEATGKFKDNIVAIGRTYKGKVAIAIAPRFFTLLIKPGEYPLGEQVWDDTRLELPKGMPSAWKDALTDQTISANGKVLMGEALKHFPVALLISQ